MPLAGSPSRGPTRQRPRWTSKVLLTNKTPSPPPARTAVPRTEPGASSRLGRWLRYAWAGPNSLLGLLLALAVGPGGRVQVVAGVVEAHGPWLAWLLGAGTHLCGGAAAMTLGHVIVGMDEPCLAACRSHEHVHVRQYERWGPFFLPAYFLASVWAYARGGDLYRDNPFEREAFSRS